MPKMHADCRKDDHRRRDWELRQPDASAAAVGGAAKSSCRMLMLMVVLHWSLLLKNHRRGTFGRMMVGKPYWRRHHSRCAVTGACWDGHRRGGLADFEQLPLGSKLAET